MAVFAKVKSDQDGAIYQSWHGPIVFTIYRYTDDLPDRMTIIDVDSGKTIFEGEVDKLNSRQQGWMDEDYLTP